MTYLRVKRFASDRDVGGKGQYMLAEKMFVKATVGEIPNFFFGGCRVRRIFDGNESSSQILTVHIGG